MGMLGVTGMENLGRERLHEIVKTVGKVNGNEDEKWWNEKWKCMYVVGMGKRMGIKIKNDEMETTMHDREDD